MKTWLSIGVVMAANALLLLNASRNRAGLVREIELTERELPVVERGRENTALFLRLTYDSGGDWLNRSKLAELGFDVSRDPGSPAGKAFYRASLQHPVFVALAVRERERGSRLEAVDAALTAEALAARYPDQNRYLISRGAVSAFVSEPPRTPAPVLQGRVGVTPRIVHVPLPHKPPLPRYSVRLRYGANWEPLVAGFAPRP